MTNINNDLTMVTRYAMGLTPEQQSTSMVDATTVPSAIAFEKGVRTATSIFPDLKHPKRELARQVLRERSLVDPNWKVTAENFKNNIEIQELEKRFRPMAKPTAPAGGTVDPKLMREFQKSQHYDDVRRLIDEAKGLKGKDYANKMKEIQKAIADADLKLHIETTSGSLKPLTKMGKAWNGVKKYTGYNAAKKGVQTALSKSSALRTAAKFGRSNAVAAASIDLVLAAPEIMQAKQTFDMIDEDGNYIHDQYDENGNLLVKGSGKEALGTEKALKQTGRVLAKTGTQVAAYAMGAKLGTAAFAAAWAAKGAALGSVAPGVGTAIGAVVGLGVGLLTSYFAGKAVENVMGKSDLDKLQDKLENEPAQQLAAKAQQDEEVLQDVLLAAQKRYNQQGEEQNDKLEQAYTNVATAYQNGEIGTVKATPTSDTPQTDEKPQATKPAGTTSPTAKPATETPAATPTDDKKDETKSPADKKTASKKDEKLPDFSELIKKLDSFLATFSSYNFGGTSFNNFTAQSNFMNPYMNFNPMQFMNYGSNQWCA